MGDLAAEKPKALLALGGKPLLEHVLESLQAGGVKNAIIVIGKHGSQVRDYFGNKYQKMALTYVDQREQMGTAHALAAAKHWAQNEFLVAHCDVLAPATTWEKLSKTKGFGCVMTLRRTAHAEKYGVVTVQDRLVAEIVEKPEKPASDLVNAGCYKFSKNVFDEIARVKKSPRGEYELTDVVKRLMRNNRVGFILEKKKIFDIGNPEELADANEEIGQAERKV
jgi:NDP-sugar pyrophosphorylase family protein